jgi:phosphatidylinositol alpha-1,6-mannosyltransferase
MASARWGLLHPRGLAQHMVVASDIRRSTRRGIAAVHCGRVLPEGLSAFLATTAGAPPYFCWVHGEELSYIDSSRELRRLAATVFRRARGILANSQNTARLLEQRGVPSRVVHVVRPGVEPERFGPNLPGSLDLRQALAPNGETVCLTVGRLQRRKGHDLVLDALARFGRDARRIRYVIVGDGEERQRLEQKVREHGLGGVVRFEGRIAASELPKYYSAADLFVHPNRVDGTDFEGFGMVFLEAAASGLPVIGGRSGGVPEAVLDGVTGALVSGEDSDELFAVMSELIEDPVRRRQLGETGRARVRAEFTWQRAADRVSALHAELACR